MHRDDTIAAIATAAGEGAVGIIRLSGPGAEAALRRCFAGWPDRAQSHRLHLGRVVDPAHGEVIDEALAVIMRAPRSFTGEDVVELQCHGGALNLRRVLAAALAAGARLAEPGEFSLRAFLNGRLDLTQAEAIAQVIAAESEAALRAAQAQLGGALSRPVARLRRALVDLLTLVEASIDFAGEEHVHTLDRAQTALQIEAFTEQVARMLRAREAGRLALGGARVALVGAPNAGKSSLFNRLVDAERAIVTDVPGTTRDTLEESTLLGARRVLLIDTAGLRDTDDRVERIGVARSEAQARSADLVCWVIDASDPSPLPPALPDALRVALDRGAALCVASQVDRLDPSPDTPSNTTPAPGRRQRPAVAAAIAARLPPDAAHLEVVTTSATSGEGLAWLEARLAERLAALQARSQEDAPLITAARHARALQVACDALSRAASATHDALPLEFIAADLRDAADALAAIVGAVASDDILGEIFSRFCVGK